MAPSKHAKRSRKKQTRLTFDPVASTSSAPASSDGASAVSKFSPAKVSSEGAKRKGMFAATGERTGLNRDDADGMGSSQTVAEGGMDIEELSSGTDPLQATIETEESSDKIKGQKSMMGYDGTNDSPNGSTPSKSKGKKSRDSATNSPASKSKSTPSRARKRVVDSDSDDDLFSSEFTRSTQPFTGASQIRRRNSRQMSSTYEFSDSEDSPTVPTPRRSSVKKPRSKAGSKSNSKDVTPSSSAKPRPKVVTQLDESDSDPVLSSPLKRRRSTAQVLTDESDVSPTKRRRGVVPNIEEEEEYSDDTIPLKVQSHSSRGEASSPITPSRVTRQKRASPRKHRTEKEKAKELMLRKRNGERIDAVTDSEPESEDERAVYDSDPELQVLKHFDDEEPDEESTTPKRKQRKNSKGRANASADENEYDSDFVVDDDDAPLGVPGLGLHDIPLQFRHASRKPLKEHFKDIVEWMIHNKLNPAFDRNDAIYEVAFDRLDKESSGYAISKFVSSQWTPDFVKAIKARPFYEERKLQPGEALLTQGEEKCEPCHHRKHPPTWGIKLRGKAYDKDSLEEIEQDYDDSENEESSSSSSSDSDEDVSEKSNTSSAGKRSRNGEGALIVREEREWLSGVTCRGNAVQAHKLLHWRYKLNQWVLEKLEEEGELTTEKLALREKMKAKKRRKYADDLVDLWEANEVIKGLWRDFNKQLEEARNVEMAGKGRRG